MNGLGVFKKRLYALLVFVSDLRVLHFQSTQRQTYTAYNRYPDLFVMAKLYFLEQKKIKVLSFGCSRGYEIITINQYFPDAKIVGVEKKWLVRQICRWHIRKLNIPIYSSLFRLWSLKFNLIFALAVLQRSDDFQDKKEERKFTFEKFNYWIIELDKLLQPGGLFVIDNTDYDFLESTVAWKYAILESNQNGVKPNRIMSDINSNKDSGKEFVYRIFIKNKL